MASASRSAWVVAASVGLVEALKDQGFCRWNYTIRSIHQHAKSHLRLRSSSSFPQPQAQSQMKQLPSSASSSSSSPATGVNYYYSSKTAEQSEESLRKVMYLSCWGPN